MITYEQAKAIEDALGAPQAAPIIAALQGLDQKIETQKAAVRADLLLELATKADIALLKADIARLEGKLETKISGLEGKLETDVTRLEGKLETEIAKVNGELKSIRLWMKLLVAVGVIGMTFFSPATVKLIELLK